MRTPQGNSAKDRGNRNHATAKCAEECQSADHFIFSAIIGETWHTTR